jgi:hypothetical protein
MRDFVVHFAKRIFSLRILLVPSVFYPLKSADSTHSLLAWENSQFSAAAEFFAPPTKPGPSEVPGFSIRFVLRISFAPLGAFSLIIPIIIFYFGIGSVFPPNESALPLLTIDGFLTKE